MEFITIGQNVNIKRTDGRVHSAVVSKINESGKSITVEWYERGETKGKEVELDAILSLNPEILDQAEQETIHAAPEPKKVATAPMNLARNATQGAIGHRTSRATINSSSILSSGSVAEHVENIPPPSQLQPPTTGIVRSRTTNNASRLASATGSGLTNTSSVGNTTSYGGGGGVGGGISAATTANSVGAANVGARRSYVVKEVERLKENREKRRARQAEIKEEKNALMNQDPGNPNWETAQMIREYQSTLEFHPLVDGQAIEDHQITVCVRKRPLSRKEVNRKEIDVISVPRKDTLIVHEPRNKVDLTKFLENHKFRFDYAFDDRCDNAMVYK